MPYSQNGAILIIVLWFIIIATLMIVTLASETRLSAKIVFHNKQALQAWNDTLYALRAAEMELFINRMPDPPGQEKEKPLGERKNKKYRFDGRKLDLAYPIPDTVIVRIYDHAGKINFHHLSKQHMRQLLEKRIGNEPAKLDALIDAWQDWIDKDDFKKVNGAEKDYYETLNPPYEPRNGPIETVKEILLIKGFDEVFSEVKMESAFTIYANRTDRINPNLATRETLVLLPGLDEEKVDIILTKRREKEFKSHNDFSEFIPPEQLTKFRPWINFSTSYFYTLAIQIKPSKKIEKLKKTSHNKAQDESSLPQDTQQAYMVTLHTTGFQQRAKILIVEPYGILPDTRHEDLKTNEYKE